MNFSQASVADVLRLTQRDEAFSREMQDHLQAIIKLLGIRNSHYVSQKIVPALTNGWYYFMTTLGNLQTLGEEYTGTLRVDHDNKIPSKSVQLVWLLLYIGGEPLLDRLINNLQIKVSTTNAITEQAKTVFGNLLNFLQENKQTLKRVHQALFYINGKYYNISNHITGIKYVLVRNWLHDDTFNKSFQILGQLSLFYIVFSLALQLWSYKSSGNVVDNVEINSAPSRKGCVLCTESIKNASATPCGHIFCWGCIYDSLKYQQNCPMCREVVHPSRIIFLQNYK